ncbi:glycosyltransferase family 2 protein [Agathobacter sp.]
MDKLVSVVIPTYGRAEMLTRALDSVKNQTYENIEIIVVNDNPENTENAKVVNRIVEQYGQLKKGITLIKNITNVGGAEARNIGLRATNGEYVSFLDDDDEILPKKIEEQVKYLDENRNCALVYCFAKTVFDDDNEDTVIYTKNHFEGNCLKELVLDGTIAATTQWLCRKSDVMEINGFENIPSKQDSTLIMDLLERGKMIGFVPEILSVYHVQQNNSISTSEKSKVGLEIYHQRCKRHYDLLSKKEIAATEYKFAEQFFLKYYKERKERKKYFKSMKKNRFCYSYYKRLYYFLFFFKHNRNK